jgi:hypothetical protein
MTQNQKPCVSFPRSWIFINVVAKPNQQNDVAPPHN